MSRIKTQRFAKVTLVPFPPSYYAPDMSFFSKWTNNISNKTYERITHLENSLHIYKHTDCEPYPDVKNALHNIHKDFVLAPIAKATANIAIVCRRFYVSAIARRITI